MHPDKEFFAALALKHTPGIGGRLISLLLSEYGSCYEALQAVDNWTDIPRFNRKAQAACRKEAWRGEAEFEFKTAKLRGMDWLAYGDDLYPERLRTISEPPPLLYYSGNPELLSCPSVAVVGARKCTEYGLETARRISSELSHKGVSVVSGLAEGIDRQAHLGGLAGVGSSIAVLGAGLDVNYPAPNADVRKRLEAVGVVVTEYPPGMRPSAGNFPYRNRIIAGLSYGVVVAEAANRSGSLITARLAMEQGREVFAIPGPLFQPTFVGCHGLLKQGAALVENGEDIIEELMFLFGHELENLAGGPVPGATPDAFEDPASKATATAVDIPDGKPEAVPAKREFHGLSPEEQAVHERLDIREKLHLDDLCRTLDWPSSKVSQALVLLEMKGAARQWPGMRYTAT